MTARGTWKAYERRVAADLSGYRVPVTGLDRDGADVRSARFSVQVKLRKALPTWLFAWLSGICETAQAEGRTGVLVLRKPRQEDVDGLVVMRYGDFIELTKALDARTP